MTLLLYLWCYARASWFADLPKRVWLRENDGKFCFSVPEMLFKMDICVCEFRSKLGECVELWVLAWMICACSLIVSESMNFFPPIFASVRPLLQNRLATISLCSVGKGERRDDQIYLITL